MASPAFGVSATGTATNASPMSVTLTSVAAGSVIVAQIFSSTKVSGTHAPVSGITDTGGLTWQRRGGVQTTYGNMEIWWAYAASAISSEAISIGLTGTYDNACVIACTFTGCNATNPWDSHGSLPAFVTAATSTAASATVSTASPDDTLLCTVATNGGSTLYTSSVPTGFTYTTKATNSGGTYYALEGNGYKQVSAQQSGITVTWGSANITTSLSDTYPMWVDALTADVGPATYARPRQMLLT